MSIGNGEAVVTEDPRRDAARHVTKLKKLWWTSMQDRRKKYARLDRRYHNYTADKVSVDDEALSEPRANIGVPLPAETVDTAVSRIHENLLGRLPYGRVIGRESSDQQKAEVVQMVMDYQMQQAGFPFHAHRIFRDAVKYGIGFGKMHFIKETRIVPEPVTFLGVQFGTRAVPRSVMQTPMLEHVHIQDIFFPLDAPDLDSAEGIVHRTWQTKHQLRMAKDGLGLPLYDMAVVDKITIEGDSKDQDPELNSEYRTRNILHGGLHKQGKCIVLEYIGKLPPEISSRLKAQYFQQDNANGDWIVTVIEGMDLPIRVEPSPYLFARRPYVAAKVIDDPGYLPGISLIEFVEKLGLTIDDLYNVMMDNLNLIINKVVYVNELAGIDQADLTMSPGKIIRGKRPMQEAMGVIEFPDLSQSAFVLINMLLGHYKEYTGITNPILGQSPGGSQTATEFSGLVAHSATRLGQFEKMLEETFMRPVFELWTLFNQQFIDQEYVVRIFKDSQYQYPKVAPEDIQGLFDYIFEGSTRAESQALRIGQIMQAIQINGTQAVPIFDPLKLGEQLLVEFGWKNIGEFLNPMFQEQYALQQQMIAIQQAGETMKAITPEQQAEKKSGNQSRQGAGAGPQNIASSVPDQIPAQFRQVLAGMKERALPQGLSEGQIR